MRLLILFILILFFQSCKKQVVQQENEFFSTILQKNIKLTVIATPLPSDKTKINLLLLNDGQDIEKLRAKEILDSVYKKKLIEPLIIVAIHTDDRMHEYGVANIPDYHGYGNKTAEYASFVINELLPNIENKIGVNKFKSVAIAGCSLGGLSAFDIAWDHSDKINKVGVFSGSFWWRDKDVSDATYSDDHDRIMLNKVTLSDTKQKLKYWFYVGDKEEQSDRDKDGIIDAVDDTRDLIKIIKSKNNFSDKDISYTESPTGRHDWPYWSKVFGDFVVWSFGK